MIDQVLIKVVTAAGYVDPASLDLSPQLACDLMNWYRRQDTVLGAGDKRAFAQDGFRIAKRLAEELGDEIEFLDETSGRNWRVRS